MLILCYKCTKKILKQKIRNAIISKITNEIFQQRFQPTQSIIIGSGGIPVEEFLTYNLESLF